MICFIFLQLPAEPGIPGFPQVLRKLLRELSTESVDKRKVPRNDFTPVKKFLIVARFTASFLFQLLNLKYSTLAAFLSNVTVYSQPACRLILAM